MTSQVVFGPYTATVDRIHDGDTLTATLDLGFGLKFTVGCRFYGINAPELSTQEGKDALAYLKTIVNEGDTLQITSHGWDKYGGRADCTLKTASGVDLAAAMVAGGHAKWVKY